MSAKCPQAEATLKTLFPEVFIEERINVQIAKFADILNRQVDYGVYCQLPGDGPIEKAKLLFKNYLNYKHL